MNRRRFLGLCTAAGAACLAGWTGYHLRWEVYRPGLTRRRLPVRDLPPALDGLKIALLSDFHAGGDIPWSQVHHAVAMAAAEKPDLIFLAGDYTSAVASAAAAPLRKVVSGLRAPHGVWAVLGNHDWFFGRQHPVLRGLTGAGATVLRNSSARIVVRGCDLWLVGVDDPVTGRHDFDAALRGVPPGALVLLLAHTPDIIYAAAELGIRAVFAGHTHGGQVCLPFLGPPIVPSQFGKRFASGAFEVEGTAMYVTRGVGAIRPLVRFNCPPEVSILTLTPARKEVHRP
jgi:hypothetical protein